MLNITTMHSSLSQNGKYLFALTIKLIDPRFGVCRLQDYCQGACNRKDEQHQFISSLSADILSMLCPGPRHTLYRFYWTLLKVPETQLTGKPSVQPLHPDSTHSSHPCERICYNPFLVSLSQQTSPDVNHRASDSCSDWHNCFKVNFRVAVRWAIRSSARVR